MRKEEGCKIFNKGKKAFVFLSPASKGSVEETCQKCWRDEETNE